MTIDELRQVLIVGGGVIGRQIAASTAAAGFDTIVYDIDAAALTLAESECRSRLEGLLSSGGAAASPHGQPGNFYFLSDIAVAAAAADLLIECVPERLALKRDIFRQFDALCPQHTVFTTNTSVLMPSMFLSAVGRPDRFAALHFVMEGALTEIMPHPRTSAETVALLEQFSRSIGYVPLVLHREQPGYLTNTMLMALNDSALTLVVNGVADFESVDRAWMMLTRSSHGPFAWLDIIGLDTAMEITEYVARALGGAQIKKNAQFLRQLVEQGRLGVKSGLGFYTYPNPAFEHPDFLGEAFARLHPDPTAQQP